MSIHRLSITSILTTTGLLLAAAAHASENVCKLTLSGNDQMQYDKKELSAPADCRQIELTLTHTGSCPLRRWVTTGCS